MSSSQPLMIIYLRDKANSPSFLQNSPSLPQNSVRLSEFSSQKQRSRFLNQDEEKQGTRGNLNRALLIGF